MRIFTKDRSMRKTRLIISMFFPGIGRLSARLEVDLDHWCCRWLSKHRQRPPSLKWGWFEPMKKLIQAMDTKIIAYPTFLQVGRDFATLPFPLQCQISLKWFDIGPAPLQPRFNFLQPTMVLHTSEVCLLRKEEAHLEKAQQSPWRSHRGRIDP